MLHFTWVIFWFWTLCAGWAHEGWGFALNPSRRTPSPVPVLISSPSPANPPVANGRGGTDGHGSVRFLTDGAGAVTDTYAYDAYGDVLSTTGSTVNPYRYTGEPWDSDLGMYYLRARYYKPDLGRFWTMDSYEGNSQDPLSLHKYLYCQGNPVNGTDPSGRDLVSTMSTMTIGTAIGMWSTIAANHALGRAQTYSSIMMGGAFGAAMGPLAVAIPEVGVGLGIYGMVGSGGIVYQTFSNPNATSSQKTVAVGLVVASIWGTKVAIKYSNATRIAPPAESVPAPGIPTFPLPLRSPPGVVIKSMAQNGLDGQKVRQLPGLICSMIEGKPIPYIAGMRNGNTYWINEGHTRMTAALELFNKTGDSSHVMKLLNEGNWKTGTPSTDIQMTSD